MGGLIPFIADLWFLLTLLCVESVQQIYCKIEFVSFEVSINHGKRQGMCRDIRSGQYYLMGQTWQLDQCTTCYCGKSGKAACAVQMCERDPPCKDLLRDNSQCCPKCKDDNGKACSIFNTFNYWYLNFFIILFFFQYLLVVIFRMRPGSYDLNVAWSSHFFTGGKNECICVYCKSTEDIRTRTCVVYQFVLLNSQLNTFKAIKF